MATRCTTAAIIVVLGGAAYASQAADVFTAVDSERLFRELGLTILPDGVPYPVFGQFGHQFHADPNSAAARVERVTIGVHPSVAAAQEVLARFRNDQPVQSDPRPSTLAVGDERHVWGGAEGGYTAFRRDNVTVCLGWRSKEGFAFVRRLDELIQKDRKIAPRGQFTPLPEVISTGVPNTLRVGSSTKVRPEVRGLPVAECWMALVEERSRDGPRPMRLSEGVELGSHAPGTEQRRLLILGPGNLIVSQVISITYYSVQ